MSDRGLFSKAKSCSARYFALLVAKAGGGHIAERMVHRAKKENIEY
jgi:type III secretion system FlhB-like substrate exporter